MLSFLLSISCQGPCHAESTQLSSFSESDVLSDKPKVQHCVKSFHCEGTLNCAKQIAARKTLMPGLLSTMPQSLKNPRSRHVGSDLIHYISAGERMSSILRIILTSWVASWIWLRLLCRVSMTPCCFMSPAPASSMQFTPSAGFFSATCTHKRHMEEGFQKRNVEQRIMEKECSDPG